MAEVKRHAIRKVTGYVDDGGREVREFEQVFGKDKEENSYVGVALVIMKGFHPVSKQPVQRTEALEFPIDGATSIKKAFELFDKGAQVEIEKRKQQANEYAKANSIVTPSGVMPKMLGPDGKPMG